MKINGLNKPGMAQNNALEIEYVFEITYNGLGKIELLGKLYLSGDEKFYREALNAWKNKQTNSEEQRTIINIIIQKATVKAFALEEEMGLPIHIPLPSFKSSSTNNSEKSNKPAKFEKKK
jgi:hypothetical protein